MAESVSDRLPRSPLGNPVWWGGFTILIGIIGICGWITGSRFLVTIFPKSITMAPVSAFLFIILGISIIIIKSADGEPDYEILLDILLLPPIIIGLWLLYSMHSALPVTFSWNSYSDYRIFLVAPESQMSLMSAILFPSLSAGTYLCRYVTRQGSLIFLAVMVCSAVFFAGYCLGHPLFYGGTLKPLSFLSACGFFCTSAGLYISLGKSPSEI